MKANKLYFLTGITFVSVLGTFLHFAYKLTGNNFVVGLFTPVNESVWEHTKLIFFPMLLYQLFWMLLRKNGIDSAFSKSVLGAFAGVLSVIVLFYTYSGIIGYNIAFLDISIFYISVIAAFIVADRTPLFSKGNTQSGFMILLAVLMIAAYIIFTLYPPRIPLFSQPQQ